MKQYITTPTGGTGWHASPGEVDRFQFCFWWLLIDREFVHTATMTILIGEVPSPAC